MSNFNDLELAIFDWLKTKNSSLIGRNPAGFLRKSIEEDYQPPDGYMDSQARQVKRQETEERRERWLQHREELVEQDLADWDKTPPEERVNGRLEAWKLQQKLESKIQIG